MTGNLRACQDVIKHTTMKYWNEQAHRKVMRGSKSIIILQRHQGVPTAKRVFSMTDTVLTGDKAAAPWEVTDAIRPLLMQVNSVGSLMDRATEQVVSLSERANRVLATSIEDSALNWSHPEDQRFILQELAAQSTLYMICIRLGIPVREEDFPAFQNVNQFDTSRISLCLGGYVQAAAEPLLDEQGHEVMQLARDSVAIRAEPVHNTNTQSPTQTTSREEAVTDDVHEREGLYLQLRLFFITRLHYAAAFPMMSEQVQYMLEWFWWDFNKFSIYKETDRQIPKHNKGYCNRKK